MANFRLFRGAVLFLLTVLSVSLLPAGEAEQAQPYETVSYPTFKNGRLETLLEAKKAEVFDLADGTPRIVLEDVVITIFDHTVASLENTPDDKPLPVRMVITSDRGFFTRRPPEPGSPPEEVANLEGNVIMCQMRINPEPPKPSPRKPNLPPEIETEIHCEHAQWNNTLRKLNGDGNVEFIQEDSRIFGLGFMYLADDTAMPSAGGSSSNIKDWGGIIYIEHNGRMEIDRDNVRTEITCKDTAYYKLNDREIHFERDVKVRRPGLTIESDILKVFLRHEDDPLPSNHTGEGSMDVLPGQVKNIVATIGKRPGSVVITGYKVREDGGEDFQFRARGGRADFDYDSQRITLIDSREQSWPEVEFGEDRDRIRDDNLIFSYALSASLADGKRNDQVLDSLNTFGGSGQVLLRTRQTGEDAGPTVPTRVTYKGEMTYTRSEGRIRFRDTVALRRGDLAIDAELLDVRLVSDGVSAEPSQVSRIFAETDVKIQSGGRTAAAARAEYDIYSPNDADRKSIDTLRLFGPEQRTPPNPWIRDERGNRIEAPEIHMQRLKTPVGQKDRHLMVAGGGTSVCDFYSNAGEGDERQRIVSIKCENGMEYDEVSGKAVFDGLVMATSDAPEDNYVLTSNQLVINFRESPNPGNPEDDLVWIRRITAEGNARLEQDVRVCEAIKIIRDFPTMDEKGGAIYLEGAPAAGGRAPQMAVYREKDGAQIGAMFAAVLIKSTSSGDKIEANGPGHLSMPDELPGYRSEIHFERYASYESFANADASRANFSVGVVLRQPSHNLVIKSDELAATFLQDDDAPESRVENIDTERIGKLRRAEFKGRVTVQAAAEKGRREGVCDFGSIDFEQTGNIIKMAVDRQAGTQKNVQLRDHDGLTLLSPAVELREGQGYTRADGPGELHIPGNRGAEGLSNLPTAIWFGDRGSMVYNELAFNIRISDRVRIVQPGAGNRWQSPSLDGSCDRLEITLLEPPSAEIGGQAALSQVQKMDALGNVIIRVYADPPADNPNIDWLSRPGTTFFTRGDRGEFFVQENRIEISGSPGRQPQLLLNVVDAGRAPHRQRMKADRFILDTGVMPRRWSFHGQPESSTIRDGEPFQFVD